MKEDQLQLIELLQFYVQSKIDKNVFSTLKRKQNKTKQNKKKTIHRTGPCQ